MDGAVALAAAPRREGVDTRNEDGFATASSIGVGECKDLRALVLLGLYGSAPRDDSFNSLQRPHELKPQMLFVRRILWL
jgi:hypothetical protein